MARRRYISTDISTDSKVKRLAVICGDFAALLYTWMIPHADDTGLIAADVEELIDRVVPSRGKTIDDVIPVLECMNDLHLIIWLRDENKIYFPCDAFYKHQTYIQAARKRTEDPNAANQQIAVKTPQNTASLSPSLSPSLTKDMCVPDETHESDSADATDEPPTKKRQRATYEAEFEEFWSVYPRRKVKAAAAKAWAARLKAGEDGTTPNSLILAARNYADECRRKATEEQYIKLPATFLGPNKPYLDYLQAQPAARPQRQMSESSREYLRLVGALPGAGSKEGQV